MSNEKLVEVYVTLVKAGRRALEENDEGIIVVPSTLIDKVRLAIENNQ